MRNSVVLLVLNTENIISEQHVFVESILFYYSNIQVPKANLPEGKVVECCHCGCRGCASGDGGKRVSEQYMTDDQSKKRDHEDETDDVRKRIADLSNLMKETEEEES